MARASDEETMAFGYEIDWEIVRPALGITGVAAAIIAPSWLVARKRLRRRSDRHMRRLIKQRLGELHSQRCQLMAFDDSGARQLARWERERAQFITTQLAPQLDPARFTPARLAEEIERLLGEYSKRRPMLDRKRMERMDPYDFEKMCASILYDHGWQTKLHGGSGDQGIDVEARKGGKLVVIQCKKYSSPIGNKAVQEALAGKVHIKADFAAVVTNAAYTKGARELSATTGVHLLHYVDLYRLDKILGL
jgi:restriction system protein